jgi:tripartite-type tricarboxylate transporter receptor subunit TctC
MKRLLGIVFVLLFVAAPLHAQAPYYQGKTITFVVGSGAGTAYDMYARLLGTHISKYIPGNPSVIMQNMPAAGGIVAANYVYGVAKPDGQTLASINPAHYFNQIQGNKEIKFDWPKFTWIASSDKSEHMLYMRADAPYRSMQDIRNAKEPPKCGATGTGTSGHYIPRLLEETLGTKFSIVTGYAGGNEIDLATERNEVVCRSFTTAAFFAREPYHSWRKKNFVRILMQTGKTRDSRLPETPLYSDLMNEFKTTELGRKVAMVMLGSGELGRPVVAHPATPPEIAKTLRDAFMKSMADPQLLAEAAKQNLEVTAVGGEDLAKIAKEVINQPPEVLERIRKLLAQ